MSETGIAKHPDGGRIAESKQAVDPTTGLVADLAKLAQALAGGHAGKTFGFSGLFFVDKKSETIVILLSNTDVWCTDDIADHLVQIARRLP